ncbi:MAG: hypothetical protein A3F13_02575 [Gammaproteobacteria bacterium RIFCSPHIGHO2_12_FULL_40_19]|nr:MAG: hypothetical protein A3F13_02575 [Gammaproteobacteria bacterium RIFCSPHIGHO2_12_FULL_40_19]
MKVSVDNKDLFTLSETQKKVIKNDIHEEIFDDDMKRRLQWVLMHKYERCFMRLKQEWEPKLRQAGVAMIPTDPDAFAEMVFTHPSYKSRSTREPYVG